MKVLNDLVKHYSVRLGNGGLEVDTTELYSNLLTLQESIDNMEWEYKDTIRMLVGIVELKDYNPNNYYQSDIVFNAKRLSKEG